jgi:hypothetical protein
MHLAAAGELEREFGRGKDKRTASRRRDAVELAIGWVLIMLVIWTPKPAQRVLYWLPVGFILAAGWLRFESWDAMGFRLRNFLRSSWVILASLALGAAAWTVAAHFGTLHAPAGGVSGFVATYIGYAIWSVVQQMLLLSFFLARFLRLIPNRYLAALAAASIFCLAHLPNPVLTPLTLIWGMVSCLVFLRFRNIWTLGLAHAVLGITVAIAFTANATHGMRVGLGYITYHPHGVHQRSHSDQMVSTHA